MKYLILLVLVSCGNYFEKIGQYAHCYKGREKYTDIAHFVFDYDGYGLQYNLNDVKLANTILIPKYELYGYPSKISGDYYIEMVCPEKFTLDNDIPVNIKVLVKNTLKVK